MASSTLTIERSYFETLLRRAEQWQRAGEAGVTVPHDSLYDLQETSRKYYNLRQALLSTGTVTSESLDVLAQGYHAPLTPEPSERGHYDLTSAHWKPHSPQTRPASVLHATNPNFTANGHTWSAAHPDHDPQDPSPEPPLNWDEYDDDERPEPLHSSQQPAPPLSERNAKRTLLLSNLPSNVTHRDVTDIIRGGRLIEFWVRPRERNATVTFADAAAASRFLHHARRKDLYINMRRVDAAWHPKQYKAPGHMLDRIRHGHSRNLAIRNAVGRLTEAQVRADLAHIDRLVVVQALVAGPDLYISTNAVHLAGFAKTCLSSRAAYKGAVRIDWYADECEQELPRVDPRVPSAETAAGARRAASATQQRKMARPPAGNMYAALDDEDGEASDAERDGATTALSGSHVQLGPRSQGSDD